MKTENIQNIIQNELKLDNFRFEEIRSRIELRKKRTAINQKKGEIRRSINKAWAIDRESSLFQKKMTELARSLVLIKREEVQNDSRIKNIKCGSSSC